MDENGKLPNVRVGYVERSKGNKKMNSNNIYGNDFIGILIIILLFPLAGIMMGFIFSEMLENKSQARMATYEESQSYDKCDELEPSDFLGTFRVGKVTYTYTMVPVKIDYETSVLNEDCETKTE